MILAATGHRPNKLGGYGVAVELQLFKLAKLHLAGAKPRGVISGMALGWDTSWAEAALGLGLPLCAAVPFEGQEKRWPSHSQEKYAYLCMMATKVVYVCEPGYAAWKMQKRNEWMVDHCDELVALWDGSDGGTANCVRYAERVGKPVRNLWSEWVR
jgi:uncharacterized phage-like protein YoqJ